MPDNAAIVAGFQAELDALARLPPRDEVRRLWQIALERESLVVVAYRRDIIGQRLDRMPLPDDAKAVIARAIRWAWRDEEAHALWIRGVLLREGTRLERATAWRTLVEGRVAGWTSSRQAHYRWRDAPVRRTVAEALELGARATGRVPRAVGDELHFQSFRDWCTFNVAAEKTAELAWARLAVVAAHPDAGVHPDDADVFARIAADEVRHGAMFGTLAAALTPDDRLLPGASAATLEAGLAAIGQRFLRSPSAGHAAWRNPLGKGAVVAVRQGDPARDDVRAVLAATLDAAGAAEAVPPGSRVALKTTFMLAVDRADPSPHVHAPLLEALVGWLVARGCTVDVLEAPNIYDRFHRGRSVREVATYLGLDALERLPGVRLRDAQADAVDHDYLRGIGAGTVSATWRDADVRLVLGTLRSHPVDRALLSLDVVEGLGGRHDAFTFSDRKADRHTALLAVADALPPDLALLDAWADVPDGLTGMMGCPHPLQPGRIYASRDALALDTVAARHVGEPPDGLLLGAARDWFGDPAERLTVDAAPGLDAPLPVWRGPGATAASSALAALALPLWDHASGRGALFVPPVDEAAFPPVEAPGAGLRAARALAQRIVETGDRPAPDDDLLPTRAWPMPWGPLRLHDSGRGATGRRPLVMVHGYPENLQLFTRLVRALPHRRCIAYDGPGQGRSAAGPHPPGPQGAADQLLALLDALELDRVDLLATDMGAHAALLLAAGHPDRVGRIVVMNSLLYGDGPTSADIAVMRRSGLNRAAFRWAPGVVWRRCLATFLDGEPLPEAHLADLHDAFQQPSVREHLVALCDGTEAAFDTLAAAYPRITAPLLALWGEREAHFPRAQGERLVAAVPDGRLQALAGGHWMVWTHAAEVAAAVDAFLGGDA